MNAEIKSVAMTVLLIAEKSEKESEVSEESLSLEEV